MRVDLNLGDGTGFDLIECMKTVRPMAEAIVISAMEDEQHALRAFELEATGYLVKNSWFGNFSQDVLCGLPDAIVAVSFFFLISASVIRFEIHLVWMVQGAVGLLLLVLSGWCGMAGSPGCFHTQRGASLFDHPLLSDHPVLTPASSLLSFLRLGVMPGRAVEPLDVVNALPALASRSVSCLN